MSVKIEIEKGEEKEINFPWIGVSEQGCVVLFYDDCKGIVLTRGEGLFIGDHGISFNMRKFREFKGKITIKNNI